MREMKRDLLLAPPSPLPHAFPLSPVEGAHSRRCARQSILLSRSLSVRSHPCPL